MSESAVRKIGEVAECTGLSIRTLRHYDDLGLVVPSGHTAGGFRLYTEADVERLLLVRRMKPLGFSLDRMRQFLEAVDVLRAAKQTGASDLPRWHEARTTVEAVRGEALERYADLKTQLEYSAEFLQLAARAAE
ncbi:MerR family transcriptional regulator [Dietzia sp. SLG310A2-38A2]|uniref:MerR family transcriptional regulator n=1 Tax=Dietzia sp. SLG310A2-38A2 TaxID=1630643 RepID=UPI0015FC34B1|nr:MerR family transcriptional regulator [Dietzia sp. SLG310A2-38A2]MBB1031717.1 MerR family transcriptional regulator [Dietzia sp. SLG310A2-38A2]